MAEVRCNIELGGIAGAESDPGFARAGPIIERVGDLAAGEAAGDIEKRSPRGIPEEPAEAVAVLAYQIVYLELDGKLHHGKHIRAQIEIDRMREQDGIRGQGNRSETNVTLLAASRKKIGG